MSASVGSQSVSDRKPPRSPLWGRKLTLYGPESGDHRGAARCTEAAAVQAPPFVQVGGGLHGYFVLEICQIWEKKKKTTESPWFSVIPVAPAFAHGNKSRNSQTVRIRCISQSVPSFLLIFHSGLMSVNNDSESCRMRHGERHTLTRKETITAYCRTHGFPGRESYLRSVW